MFLLDTKFFYKVRKHLNLGDVLETMIAKRNHGKSQCMWSLNHFKLFLLGCKVPLVKALTYLPCEIIVF